MGKDSISQSSRNLLLNTLHHLVSLAILGLLCDFANATFLITHRGAPPSARVSSRLVSQDIASSQDFLLGALHELCPSFVHVRRLLEVPAARFSRTTNDGWWQRSRGRLHPRDQSLKVPFQLHLDPAT